MYVLLSALWTSEPADIVVQKSLSPLGSWIFPSFPLLPLHWDTESYRSYHPLHACEYRVRKYSLSTFAGK